MISESNAASAMGGKTARACDSCAKRRARWFCAADDAFLCQSCDSSVHSANPLARRHERVRLKTASFGTSQHAYDEVCAPTWHQGFTRKARTPRHNNNNNNNNKLIRNPFAKKSESVEPPVPNLTLLVPDLGADDTTSHEENEEQLLYRVPVLDPFEATPANTNKLNNNGSWDAEGLEFSGASETKAPFGGEHESEVDNMVKGATSFLPSETELAEFAADVEVLLGKGLEQECFGMDELGLAGSDCGDGIDHLFLGDENGALRLKVKDEEEEEDQEHVYMTVDGAREPFELRFEDFDTPARAAHGGEDGRRAVKAIESDNWEEMGSDEVVEKKVRNKIVLRLDYEEVIAAWAGQGSPWKGGCRPEINPDDCWPDCMGGYGLEAHLSCEHGGGIGGQQGAATADGGREARVSRYREKRRTRLFSKKIRYEVRKLNAEKRPRMKGRFVKRASFLGPAAPFALLNK